MAVVRNDGNRPNLSADVQSRVLPNILDRYSVYTYHFKLFMMSEDAIRTGNFGPAAQRDRRIVLAESAGSTIGIEDVVIESIAGLTKEAGIGMSTTFKMTLKQPFGATFVDLVAQAAQQLEIKNYQKAPYFLELTFRARDPDTSQPVTEDEFSNLRWVWPILFTTMTIDVNAGGSVYNIEAVNYADMAYTNQAADLQKTVTVDANTVGEFFENFERELNKRDEDKQANGQMIPNRYEFYVDETIAKERIVLENVDQVAGRSGQFETVGDKTTIVFQPRTSIDKIVEAVLSTTRFFQKEAIGSDDPDRGSTDANRSQTVKKLYRLIADTQIGEYDIGRNDYSRTYRYLVVPYEMTTLQSNPNERQNVTSERRLSDYRRRGVLRKVYNYIYTGLNDQVLDFNLTFNFNWYVALPWQAGLFTDPVAFDPGARDGAAREIVEDSVQNTSRSQRGAKGFVNRLREGLQQIDETQERLRETISTVQGFSNAGLLTPEVQNELEVRLSGRDTITQEDFGEIREGVFRTAINNYIDDNNNEILAETLNEKIQQINNNIDPFIISFIETTPGISQNFSLEDQATPGRTLLSALFEQAESPLAADLLNIELKIKGDPFWLEPSPVGFSAPPLSALDRELQKRGFKSPVGDTTSTQLNFGDSDSDDDTSNITTSRQTFFLFRSFSPQEFDPDSGLTPKFTDNNVLNGIYGVRTVTHEFTNGQFNQTLNAVRDPLTNINNVRFEGELDPVGLALANGNGRAQPARGLDGTTDLSEIQVSVQRRGEL